MHLLFEFKKNLKGNRNFQKQVVAGEDGNFFVSFFIAFPWMLIWCNRGKNVFWSINAEINRICVKNNRKRQRLLKNEKINDKLSLVE